MIKINSIIKLIIKFFKLKPTSIRIDAATVCQLRCPTCPTAAGVIKKTIGGGYLKLVNFQTLLDKNKFIKQIEFSNWGEVFLNPELLEILKYAFERKIEIYLANGVNLNNVREEVLEGVVKYQIKFINCSIDGTDQRNYSIYRRNGNFDTVINNIKKINHYKKLYNSELPVLQWQYVIFGHNEDKISLAREMAQSLGMLFYPKLSWGTLYDENYFSPIQNHQLVREQLGNVFTSREQYEEENKKPFLKIACRHIWNNPQINFDGKLLGCPINYWGDFGNVFDDGGIIQSFNSPKIKYARMMHLGKVPAKKDIPCSTCSVYKKMHETKSWFKLVDLYRPPRILRFRSLFRSLKKRFAN